MGNGLDKPDTSKDAEMCEGNGLSCGVVSMQGWRPEMEDAHLCVGSIDGRPECAIFGVFDGHGGSRIAHRCSAELVPCLQRTPGFASAKTAEEWSGVLYNSFIALDAQMRRRATGEDFEDRSGATAVVALVTPTDVLVANAGDSRCVLGRAGRSVEMSEDHKPTNAAERRRIVRAGGSVALGRVNGELAVSRAMGDYGFKGRRDLGPEAQMVTAAPDVRSMSRHARDELLVLACDGVWDVISSDDAVRFVRDRLRSAVAPAGAISGAHITSVVDAAGALVEHALDAGSRDNMTASVVLFNLTPEAANKLRAGGAGEATDASAGPGRPSASRDRHDSAAQSSAPGSDTGSRRKALRTRGSGRNLHVVSGEEESLGSGMGIRVTPRPGSTRAGGPSSDVGSKRGGFFGGSPGGDATAAAAAQPVPSEPAGSEHSAAAEPPVSAVGGVAITAAADRRARHRHSRAGHATGRDAHGRRLYSGRTGHFG
ncbi:hypothetical protein FNF27_05868 [Cafeteria roenbergensis]|uniref:PPM-type phosphatase domain-containing protein n=1 Tax=Cafeteria roenbergensis TaxID=33653 RepID=A0A5A8E6D7_CAFRO|nr:hypothetical protein FNF27_05868 [Cafeteria roenbergensis]